MAGMVGSKFMAPFTLRIGRLDLGVPDRDGDDDDDGFGDVLLLPRRSLFDRDLGDNRMFSSWLPSVAAATAVAVASISDGHSRVDDRSRLCCCRLLEGDTGKASKPDGVEVASSSLLLDDADESKCSSKSSSRCLVLSPCCC